MHGDIETQEHLNRIGENCEYLGQRLRLSENFAGPFFLPGVTTMNATFYLPERDPPKITSFEMPDLEYALYLSLRHVPLLEKLSLPQLSSAHRIVMDLPSTIPSVELPSLGDVSGDISINGNSSK